MTSETMLSGHIAATVERAHASDSDYLIAAQDTTYYNYSGHESLSGLGVIQGKLQGLMQHNVLLCDELGLPLGLLNQQYWTRQGGMDLPAGVKESQKWFNGLSAVNQQAKDSDKRWVVTCDREGDIFEFFKAERAPSVDLLVRVFQPRRVEVLSAGTVRHLSTVAEHLDDYGQYQVQIERDHRTVELTLRLQGAAVSIYPGKDLSIAKHKTQGLSLVVATEVACQEVKSKKDCFSPKKAVTWFLLTSLPIDTPDDLQRVVRFYALRWRIERLHFTLKSGALDVEKLQFDDIHTLTNGLAFYSVVAWQLLALTYGLRHNPDRPAEAIFDETEVTLLKHLARKPIRSLRDAVLAMTKLIGFAPSKKQPLPGIKVLATAIERFSFSTQAAQALAKPLQD